MDQKKEPEYFLACKKLLAFLHL